MDLSKAKTETIGHLGLVAATIHQLGMMDKVDDILGKVAGGLRHGYRVGAMVLNGLGFINTALYMSPRFFHDKPLSLLLGEGVTATQLNDDSLGRCLDKIAAYGPTKWYSELALEMVSKAGLLSRAAHIDSTTLSLYGAYDGASDDVHPKPLLGYSKEHRPDLKQVTLQCVSLGKGALPIWMEALDGNSSDKKSFPETVKKVEAFYQQLKSAPKMCFVGDSALYGEQLSELKVDWLTRVPEVYKEAKLLCERQDIEWLSVSDSRYKIFEYSPEGKAERWLLVHSEPAFQRESQTFLRRHEKSFDELQKSLWHCACQLFNCESDARKAVEKVIRAKKHFYDVSYTFEKKPYFSNKGRPQKNQLPDGVKYQVVLTGLSSNLIKISQKRKTLGRFILATNVLDKACISNESMLLDYKEQSSIERGFRFIKNDTFGLDEVILLPYSGHSEAKHRV